jgi:adenylate cyclase
VVGRAEPLAIFTLVGDDALAKSPEFQALRAAHARMIAAYRGQLFAEAQEALMEARKGALPPLRAFYAIYEERIAALVESPPPGDWDGVFISAEK